MATFGLVHGGCHGAWQWGQLIAEMATIGHRVVVVDLPIDDPALGVADYAALCAKAFVGQEDLIVVGHSLGGFVIPFIAELIKVRTLVLLAGAIQPGLLPGLPPPEEMLLIPSGQIAPGDDGLIRISDAAAQEYFYHDLSTSMRAWATPQLRPQSARGVAPDRQPSLDPDTTFASIICTGDRAISADWSQVAARDALHVEPYSLPGSHSPFLTSPAALANVLHAIAAHQHC